MKTLQEPYDEIIADDERKRAFVEVINAGNIDDFMRQHDCPATTEEVKEFLEAKAAQASPTELTAEQLEEVAGGTSVTVTSPCGPSGTDSQETCSCTCIDDCR